MFPPNLLGRIFYLDLQTFDGKGRVAEWLGTGLQNLLQRFESVRDLQKT